jgi:hypothetical protein
MISLATRFTDQISDAPTRSSVELGYTSLYILACEYAEIC